MESAGLPVGTQARSGVHPATTAGVGAAAFVVSDSMIAIGEFTDLWTLAHNWQRVLAMTTYWSRRRYSSTVSRSPTGIMGGGPGPVPPQGCRPDLTPHRPTQLSTWDSARQRASTMSP